MRELQDVIERLAGITRILALPEVRDKLANLGFELAGGTPDEFGALIRNGIARVAEVVREAGIRAE